MIGRGGANWMAWRRGVHQKMAWGGALFFGAGLLVVGSFEAETALQVQRRVGALAQMGEGRSGFRFERVGGRFCSDQTGIGS